MPHGRSKPERHSDPIKHILISRLTRATIRIRSPQQQTVTTPATSRNRYRRCLTTVSQRLRNLGLSRRRARVPFEPRCSSRTLNERRPAVEHREHLIGFHGGQHHNDPR